MRTLDTHDTREVREHLSSATQPLVSWKAILAGLLVALTVYTTLTLLGIGIGAASLSEIVESGESVDGLGTGTLLWIAVSTIISLGVGSYFAARISTFITKSVGAAQGITIASLYFALMILGAGQIIGMTGRGLGNIASTVGANATDLLSNTRLQVMVEDTFEEANLKSEPEVVVKGVLTRLAQGNTDSARRYFASQTGLTEAQVSERFARLENDFKATTREAAVAAAEGVSRSAWGLFIILVAGIAFSIFGGAWGAQMNFRQPLSEDETLVPHLRSQTQV